MATPLRFLQASVRADELVAHEKIGIGTDSQSVQLHIKADAPEIRLEDRVGAEASETATRIYADSGNTYILSGVNFDDGSSSNIVFGSMGNATEFVNIGAHGIETTGGLFVNNIEFQQLQGLEQITNISNTTSNTLNTTNTTASTSTGTGAITCAGGLGVSGNVHASNLFASDYVGIGTTSPGSLLTFYKDYPVPANGSEPADDTTQCITFRSDLNSYGGSPAPTWSNETPVDVAKIWFQPKSYEGISASAGTHGYLAFGTGYFGSQSNTPDMVINTSGNVGIGTADPQYRLDVNGVARLNNVAFAAYRSQTSPDASFTGKVVFNNVYFDQSGNFDTDTGLFNAPVAGIYHFSFNAYTNYSGATVSRLYIYKNESIYTQKGDEIDQHGNGIDVTMKLEVDDTVSLRGSSAYPVYLYAASRHNIFCGHLLTAV